MMSHSSSARSSSLYRQYSSSGNTSSSSLSSENLPPRTLARVARELRNLHKNPPEGVRVIVEGDHSYNNHSGGGGNSSSSLLSTTGASESSLNTTASSSAVGTTTTTTTNLEQVLCEMQGPTGTPYEGRFFVLKLVFTGDFPMAPPRGYFVTKLYHPNVDPQTGAICVNTLKKDWTSETTLSHVLAVIRCLLIVPFPESSLNDEAGKLFMESYQEYAKRAKLMTQVHGRLYNMLGQAATDEMKPQQPTKSDKLEDSNNNNLPQLDQNSCLNPTEDDPSKTSSLPEHYNNKPPTSPSSSKNSNPLRSSDNSNKKTSKPVAGGGGGNAKLSKKKSLKRL